MSPRDSAPTRLSTVCRSILRDGEFFVLLGPTGAGKTTTLRLIAGLEMPDDGTIEIADQDVRRWSAAERDVALVFQYYSLYPRYTVRQNLAFPLKSNAQEFLASGNRRAHCQGRQNSAHRTSARAQD